MIILLGFAFLAGLVTVLAPCILPILPIVLSGGAVQGKYRPWGIIIGVVLSFSIFTLTLSWLVQHLGLSPNFSRQFGIAIIAALAVAMLIPGWLEKFEGWISTRLSRSGAPPSRHGFGGGILLGFSLGTVWTPCAGPVLASVTTLAATGGVTTQTVFLTIAYAVGAAVPMGLIALFGQKILARVRWFNAHARQVQQAFAILLLVVVGLMITNTDRKIQVAIIKSNISWLPNLQKFEENAKLPGSSRTSAPLKKSDVTLQNYGPAPELIGLMGWINSQPLTLAQLRGKVVLIKFWTYSCINCIRTLPYVQAWYDKYHDQGFEIIAVHSPEFAFEKIPANVEKAVKDFKMTYPVALDPDFATWNAYSNRYWPAKYFIDAKGNLRYVHFGEGDYAKSEQVIQELLKEAGHVVTGNLIKSVDLTFNQNQTPETYFGLARAARFLSSPALSSGSVTYTPPQMMAIDHWALDGRWTVTDEYVAPDQNGKLLFRVRGRQVYLVMSADEGSQPLNVLIDGQAGSQLAVSPAAVGEPTLYRIAQFNDDQEHTVQLEFPQGQVKLYAATFGGGDTPGLACASDGKCQVVPLP